MAALLRFVDARENRIFFELGRPRLLVHRQDTAADDLAGEYLSAGDVRRASRPQARSELRMDRHRDGCIALTFLSGNLHSHLSHDLAQVGRPETVGISKPQERVVQDVEHQPCFGTQRPLRPIAGHVVLGPGHKTAGLTARLCLAGL
ncbi:hypothetical protein JJE66_35610 [Bradyrhizobium diazoefficiens]|uniref:hypothetical protein n=1 Tax=Bradyrhizobium diazoefficiens TaxID=1355477 RepID=UPI00190C76EC|nr:hypothetical protein [Bradyrhizobium diazoefficiens]MBK3666527.1 hypothetical protein [Bradyrhizobium diazoefficiens]